MRATDWEFANRALVFGLIVGLSFPLYAIDPQTSTAALARWLGSLVSVDPTGPVARWLDRGNLVLGVLRGVTAFALTLKLWLFALILCASVALFWVSSTVLQRK